MDNKKQVLRINALFQFELKEEHFARKNNNFMLG
jgi:hypothetical protein